MDISSPLEIEADSTWGRVSSGRGAGKGGFRRNRSCEKSDMFSMNSKIRRGKHKDNG
jgi:hypothetical protein